MAGDRSPKTNAVASCFPPCAESFFLQDFATFLTGARYDSGDGREQYTLDDGKSIMRNPFAMEVDHELRKLVF